MLGFLTILCEAQPVVQQQQAVQEQPEPVQAEPAQAAPAEPEKPEEPAEAEPQLAMYHGGEKAEHAMMLQDDIKARVGKLSKGLYFNSAKL